MNKYDTLNFNKEEAYFRAQKKVKDIIGFYWHLTVYVVINIFLIVMIVINKGNEESIWNFGTFATAFFWGIGLFFHFLGIFGPAFIFGRRWEQRKIHEFMEKEKKQMNQL